MKSRFSWAFGIFLILASIFPMATRAEAPRPVILVPGIAGSDLWDDGNKVWLDLVDLFDDYPFGQNFLSESLALDSSGTSIEDIDVGDIVREASLLGMSPKDIYQGLIEDLESEEYIESSTGTLFVFPYDWRLDLEQTSQELAAKISQIKVITGATSVDIVAHSMGGLLVKNYLSASGTNDTSKIIFVGTPHLGAPKAAKTLLYGDKVGIPFLRPERIQEIAINSPAIYELLPRSEYFEEIGGYVQVEESALLPEILDYEETKNLLFDNEEGNLNDAVFGLTQNFYDSTSSTDFGGADVYNFAGCKLNTPIKYHFGPSGTSGEYETILGMGDETVPFLSANSISIASDHKYYVNEVLHAELPSGEGVRQAIVALLTGQEVPDSENLLDSENDCGGNGKLLTWRGSAAPHAYGSESGPDDQHLGPIEDGFEAEIQFATYDAVGDQTSIFLPENDDLNYHVVAYGVDDNSSFDLRVTKIVDSEAVSTAIFNDVFTNSTTQTEFYTSSTTSDTTLNWFTAGQGSQQISAIATLFGDDQNDLAPPITTASASGTFSGGGYTSVVDVTLSATDPGAGVYRTLFSIDGGTTYQFYSNPLRIVDSGTTTIQFYSIDYAGNDEVVGATNTVSLYLARPRNVVVSTASSCSYGTSCQNGNVFTREFTVMHDDHYLVVDVYQQSTSCSGTVTATYNGDSLTQTTSVAFSSQHFKRFELADPDLGTHSLVVTKPSGSCDFEVMAAVLANVNLSDPKGTVGTNSGNGGSPSTTVTGAAGGMIYSSIASPNDIDVSPGSGLTMVVNAASSFPGLMSGTTSASGSAATPWTIASQGCCAYWALISTPYKRVPLDTTITTGPNGLTASTSASLTFTASEDGATFMCSFDSGSYAPCTSPKNYSGLAVGVHSLSVYAVNAYGVTDATPAVWTWNVTDDVVLDETAVCTQNSPCFSSPVATLSMDVDEADEYLIVNIYRTHLYCNGNVTAVYAGATMTPVATVGTDTKWEQFELRNPATGVNDLVVTRPSGSCDTAVIAALFKGVDLDDPYDGIGAAQGATGPETKSATATGVAGGLVYSVLISPNVPTIAPVFPLGLIETETSHPTTASAAGTSQTGALNTNWIITNQTCCAYWAILSTPLNPASGEFLQGGGGGEGESMMGGGGESMLGAEIFEEGPGEGSLTESGSSTPESSEPEPEPIMDGLFGSPTYSNPTGSITGTWETPQ